MVKYLLVIQSLVILLLVFMLAIYGKDEFHDKDGEEFIDSQSFAVKGNRLFLTDEVQKLIGLKVY